MDIVKPSISLLSSKLVLILDHGLETSISRILTLFVFITLYTSSASICSIPHMISYLSIPSLNKKVPYHPHRSISYPAYLCRRFDLNIPFRICLIHSSRRYNNTLQLTDRGNVLHLYLLSRNERRHKPWL